MAKKDKFLPFSKREYGPLGPESKKIIETTEKYSAKNYPPYPFVVERSKGPWLYDPDGNKALDFLSAYSSILTHKNKDIINAVKDELSNGTDLTSRAVYTTRLAEFVEKIHEVTGYARSLPKSDGGSVTDTAVSGLLMHGARKGIKNPEVILTDKYFHGRGWIFGSNALFDSDQSGNRVPKAQGIVVVEDNLEAISNAVNENTTGIFIETHKGEGGPLFSTKEYFMGIKKIATDNNLFLGCDEIQTGLGRCGHILAWQEYGEEARPDFVTLGKALGGGVIPVSAIAGTEEYMDIFIPGSDGSTHGGYSIACAAACASLDYIIKEGIPKKAKEIGDYFVKQFQGVQGITVENRGALIRVELEGLETAKYACLEMLVGEKIKPRVFMKHGHNDPERNVAYTRIAPPIGAMTEKLIDKATKKTIIPTLMHAIRFP